MEEPHEMTREEDLADLERTIEDMRQEIEGRRILLALLERDLARLRAEHE